MKIKRRVWISIILAGLFLYLTSGVWFVFKDFPVHLNLDGNVGNINITVIFNKRNNDKFKKTRKTSKVVFLDKNKNIDFLIKDIQYPKRLRIDFLDLKNQNPITVKEVLLKNKKIEDLNNFILQGGELKIENDNLIIYPKEENCRLYYNKRLICLSAFDFEVELFIIILILSYLLSYKITDYIASFSTIKNKSRIEILFLTLFFVLLFLPMSYIDKNEISKKENRTLAKWQPLINQEGEFNYNFGKDIDAYLSDRFFLRDDLIKFYYKQFMINKNLRTKKVIKGKDNWLFHGIPAAINMYKKENLFSEDDLKYAATMLTQYNDYCKKTGKKFYFYIAPSKSMVYDEFYSELIKPKKENKISLANQLVDYLGKNTDIKVIYPLKELKQNKDKSLLYWKTDTHWNEYGAYIGYKVLMNEINKDLYLKELNITKFDDVKENSGDLDKNLPKALRIKEFENYKKPYVSENYYKCQETLDETDMQNCKGVLNDKKLLMFRDSFTINLIPYLASTFKTSRYIWQPKVEFGYMNDADVVVLELVEVNLSKLIGDGVEM